MGDATDASASKPYLLYVEPETYDLGDDSLTLKPFVDIEGSGELNTVITSEVCPGGPDSGTVEGADDSEMRFFTARNTCSEDGERPAILNDSASVRLIHVTAEATGGEDTANGFPVLNEGVGIGKGPQ